MFVQYNLRAYLAFILVNTRPLRLAAQVRAQNVMARSINMYAHIVDICGLTSVGPTHIFDMAGLRQRGIVRGAAVCPSAATAAFGIVVSCTPCSPASISAPICFLEVSRRN